MGGIWTQLSESTSSQRLTISFTLLWLKLMQLVIEHMCWFEIELRELNRWYSFWRCCIKLLSIFISQQRVTEKVEKVELRTMLLPRTGGLQVLLSLSTTRRFTISIMQPLPSSLTRKQTNRQTSHILPAPRDFSPQRTENAKINAVGRF